MPVPIRFLLFQEEGGISDYPKIHWERIGLRYIQKVLYLKGVPEKARNHSLRCMEDSFAYAKSKLAKSHSTPDFKLGALGPVSTTHFNNKGCKKLKDSFSGPFFINALHGENSF
ncbi:hypothetical protein O181_058974 [Austropuccinia psidii MF-1]|uniref:Uncharacterized protein n=1 Tax=Austropuccinia psidii MF-1 TaxID=1389203 RepID=A0A9Q3EDI9_9BASI|nr:hypothetical protein [Austropuccinia psidii MF-1]